MIDPNMTFRPNFNPVRRLLAVCVLACAGAAALVSPAAALAQDEEVKRDARLEGYDTKVHLDSDSTALTWLLLVFLTMVAAGVMFKHSKRTHLD